MMERKGIKITTSGEMLAIELKRELEKHLNVTVRWEDEFYKIILIIDLIESNYRVSYEIDRFEDFTNGRVHFHYEQIKTRLINGIIYKQ